MTIRYLADFLVHLVLLSEGVFRSQSGIASKNVLVQDLEMFKERLQHGLVP